MSDDTHYATLDIVDWPTSLRSPLNLPSIKMLSPGPTNFYKRVKNVLQYEPTGPFHEKTFELMDEIKMGLQYLFQTRNAVTAVLMSSGHGAMDASLCNLIEDNDVVLIADTGIWSERAVSMAKRYGADVRIVDVPVGEVLRYEQIDEAMKKHRPSIFYITHGDSTTGVLHQLEGLGDLCHKYNALLVVDAVATIGGIPFHMDRWKIDVAFTASQKAIGASSGLSPISFSARAMNKVLSRKSLIKVFYFDITLIGNYWGCFNEPRVFHNTPSTTLLFGLREALATICEDGLEACWQRFATCAQKLAKGIEDAGYELLIKDPKDRMATVTTVLIPDEIGMENLQNSFKKNDIDVGNGLGPLFGKIVRIGLLGPNASEKHVDDILDSFKEAAWTNTTLDIKNIKI